MSNCFSMCFGGGRKDREAEEGAAKNRESMYAGLKVLDTDADAGCQLRR